MVHQIKFIVIRIKSKMINKLNFSEKLDKAGMTLSLLCLVHCLLLPVILVTLPFASFLSFMKDPTSEALMILLAIINSVVAVALNFKHHKKYAIPALFITGSLLLVLHFVAHGFIHHNEYIITIGAFLIGIAHFINHKLCKSCPKCKDECQNRSI